MRTRYALLVLLAPAWAGCSSDANQDATEEAVAAKPSGVAYFGLVAGSCTPAPATRGIWNTELVFHTSPKYSVCKYTWAGTSAPQVSALTERGIAYLSAAGKDAANPSPPDVDIESGVPNFHRANAVHGCDVCGIQHGGKIHVIFPDPTRPVVDIPTVDSNGQPGMVSLRAKRLSQPAVSFSLPAAPRGQKYVDGPVYVP